MWNTTDQPLPSGRALVAVDPRTDSHETARPLADFVAQLLASRDRLPGFRKARQTEPASAVSLYGAPASRTPGALDRTV